MSMMSARRQALVSFKELKYLKTAKPYFSAWSEKFDEPIAPVCAGYSRRLRRQAASYSWEL